MQHAFFEKRKRRVVYAPLTVMLANACTLYSSYPPPPSLPGLPQRL